MKTMQQRFEKFMTMVYPEGTSTRQRVELEAAFFAGALSAKEAFLEITNTIEDEERGADAVSHLFLQIETGCGNCAGKLLGRTHQN